MSRGRLVLGVSTSWQAEEYSALGVPSVERGRVLDETIAACRKQWSSEIDIQWLSCYLPGIARRPRTRRECWRRSRSGFLQLGL